MILRRDGLRTGEGLDLAETDVDTSRGAVLVRRGNGGRRREVRMDRAGSRHESNADARVEVRARHVARGRAHRTLRYQRAALPAGQFSMTPTISYPRCS